MLNPTPNKGIGLLRLSKNITATITTSVGIKSSSKLQSKYIPILLSNPRRFLSNKNEYASIKIRVEREHTNSANIHTLVRTDT